MFVQFRRDALRHLHIFFVLIGRTWRIRNQTRVLLKWVEFSKISTGDLEECYLGIKIIIRA